MENLVKDTSKMRGHHPKSEFKKGCVPWNKGLSGWISKKHLEKLRQSNIGKIVWNKGLYGINSGESNPNWKGGYHDKEHGLRRTQEWKKWRLFEYYDPKTKKHIRVGGDQEVFGGPFGEHMVKCAISGNIEKA